MGVEPVPVQGNVRWTAYTYAGELPTSAFGFNSAGIGFTLNAVFPSATVTPGVARNFVSRQLLAATSFRWASSLRTCGDVSICKLACTERQPAATHFLHLLQSPFRQAVDIAQLPQQSVGHSVNIMSAREGRVANVEVGPGSVASVQAVTNGTLFHANSFLRLRVPEVPDPSSTARLARAAQMKVGPTVPSESGQQTVPAQRTSAL